MIQRSYLIAAVVIIMLFLVGCGGDTGGNGVNCVQASAAGFSLKWDPPTTNEDGSPLTDLEGYNIYYGASAGDLVESVNVGLDTSYTLTLPAPGKWFLAVTAYNLSGTESRPSNLACVDAM